MECLNSKYQLIDTRPNNINSLCLSKYGIQFFEQLGRDEIYFSYVLLTKHIMMEDVINKAFKTIKANIEQDQLYRISNNPPDQQDKPWQ